MLPQWYGLPNYTPTLKSRLRNPTFILTFLSTWLSNRWPSVMMSHVKLLIILFETCRWVCQLRKWLLFPANNWDSGFWVSVPRFPMLLSLKLPEQPSFEELSAEVLGQAIRSTLPTNFQMLGDMFLFSRWFEGSKSFAFSYEFSNQLGNSCRRSACGLYLDNVESRDHYGERWHLTNRESYSLWNLSIAPLIYVSFPLSQRCSVILSVEILDNFLLNSYLSDFCGWWESKWWLWFLKCHLLIACYQRGNTTLTNIETKMSFVYQLYIPKILLN